MSLFSAAVNAFSSQQAAKAQKRAADAGLALQKSQFEQTRGDLAPYRNAGATASTRYADLMGNNGDTARNAAFATYKTDPAYDWQRNQAIDSVQGSAAARGSLFSGNTLRAISDRTQQIANTDYSNYLARLAGMSNSGQQAAASTGAFGANYANAASGLYQDRGNANANSIMAPAMGLNQFTNNAAKAIGAFGGFG